ncbi:MAG: CocE/NonD family hydrolase [Alphaproteobacteria bacterium]|nr:CocE/NonD family hydrolase [Alphaproteobacteria bacterium]
MKFLYLLLILLLFNTNVIYCQSIIINPQDSIEIKEIFIPMADGTNLATDLYLPSPLPNEKLPIILEYIPYRKDEGRMSRYNLYAYFIKRGYIVARVDVRGTGRSQGKLVPYEYSEQELLDGECVIDYLSKLPFCNSNIAMFGISWGGFNGLHLAQRNPPALKTIITLMSTDDLYQDDVHYIDGIMHVDAYEIGQDLHNALPAAPEFDINQEYFKNRFDTEPWLLQYKKQQRDGSFWNRTATKNFYDSLKIPIFAIGGLFDGYRDFVLRLLQEKPNTTKALIGPYNHSFPHHAEPPPQYEWRQDAEQWLDLWLKNKTSSVIQEPRFDLFIQEWRPPTTKPHYINGFWMSADRFPLEHTDYFLWTLTANHQLHNQMISNNQLPAFPKIDTHYLKYKPSVGLEASGSVMWWGDWAPDQKKADLHSLVYETTILNDSFVLAGFPKLQLKVHSTAPQTNWIVRLSDVAPDGSVIEITGAGFNGTHRYSATNPQCLSIDSFYILNIELHVATWVFTKGHKMRLSISNAQWPMFWPTPYLMTTALVVGGQDNSILNLPILKHIKASSKKFMAPQAEPNILLHKPIDGETNSGFAEISNSYYNPKSKTTIITATNSGKDIYDFGTEIYKEWIRYEINDLKPEFAKINSDYSVEIQTNKGNKIVLSGYLIFESDRSNFYYTYTRKIYKNKALIRTKTWHEKIKRDFQ